MGGGGWVGGGNQDPGDPGVEKVREGEGGREDFFPFKQGGGLTLNDTMIKCLYPYWFLF